MTNKQKCSVYGKKIRENFMIKSVGFFSSLVRKQNLGSYCTLLVYCLYLEHALRPHILFYIYDTSLPLWVLLLRSFVIWKNADFHV